MKEVSAEVRCRRGHIVCSIGKRRVYSRDQILWEGV